MRVAGFAIAIFAVAAPASAAKPVDWTRTVALQPSGGFRMGNPQAKVKLIEYGSMTCPHCRAFDASGVSPLIAKYVKPGKVSYEFRNYVRDAYDLSASLIARCSGAKGFFRVTRALYSDQPKWVAAAQSATPERIEAMRALPQNRLFLEAARIAGLQKWGSAHGITVARSTQCLGNTREIDRLAAMNKAATDDYPDFAGTPTFILNGKTLQPNSWDGLEPQLREALGS